LVICGNIGIMSPISYEVTSYSEIKQGGVRVKHDIKDGFYLNSATYDEFPLTEEQAKSIPYLGRRLEREFNYPYTDENFGTAIAGALFAKEPIFVKRTSEGNAAVTIIGTTSIVNLVLNIEFERIAGPGVLKSILIRALGRKTP